MCMGIYSSTIRCKTCFLACNLLCSTDWVNVTYREKKRWNREDSRIN
uniref:Uncharacterized protein n=1 Tax=Arundo donax TaxID=35708 RepID=A0A0A9HD75_ARUDO